MGLVAALLMGLVLGVLGRAQAEEAPAPDVGRELRRAARDDLPLAERRAAAELALATVLGVEESEAFARAATRLLQVDAELALRLLLRATREGTLAPATLERLRQELDRLEVLARKDLPPALRVPIWAARLLVGRSVAPESLLYTWPLQPAEAQALSDVLGPDLMQGDAAALRARLEAAFPTLAALWRASSRDEAEARQGLEDVLAQGEAALPLLLSQARRLVKGVPPGHLARGLDVLALLGQLGRREATPVLMACMEAPQGWVRYAAASALGDLGDPAAAVVLARQLAYAGDPFRARESWDYPGTTETTLKPEEWGSVEYYVIDVAAADALLGMGAPGAAGWLIRNALNPARRNLRIRVPQDALDSLRRHLPTAPLPDALVDGSLPARFAAYEALEAWWRAHRGDADLLGRAFPRADAGFVLAAQGLATRLTQPKVLELMIGKDSCEILGAALTPALTQALATARPGAQTELARALARTRDPDAVPALLGLLAAPQGFVRAAAAESLDVFAGRSSAAVSALRSALDDGDCGVRVAAMKGLVGAPADPATLAAVRAHDPTQHAERCGADSVFAWMRDVALLVQEGPAHWPAVRVGLTHTDRVVRRTVWDLLRVSLDLPEHMFDPLPGPDAEGARGLDEARVLAALASRRGA